MIGQLSPAEIEQLLFEGTVAHVGCHSNGYTYVVPIHYVYDGRSILGYSPDGLKTTLMRENPNICVQIDEIESVVNWRCVIAAGRFEELDHGDADDAIEALNARLRQLTRTSNTPSYGLDSHARALNRKRTIAYRILLERKSGRFERPTPSPQ